MVSAKGKQYTHRQKSSGGQYGCPYIVVPECTEEPAHFGTIEMHSSHTVSLHCYAEPALHCRDCDPTISAVANYPLTLETFIFRVQSQVIVRMKVCKMQYDE